MGAPDKEILKVLVAILRSEMDLAADQVVIYNQRWLVPSDFRLYVSINLTGSRPYGVNRGYKARRVVNTPTESRCVLDEELSINSQDIVTINAYSSTAKDGSCAARARRNEVVMALNSTFAEQQQERYGFSIGRVPLSYVDVSEGEGTEMLTRYALTYNVLYAQSASKPVEFIDQVIFGKTTPVLQP